MNKKILSLIPILILSLLLIIINNKLAINNTFLTKHIIIFLLLGYILSLSIYSVYKSIIKNYEMTHSRKIIFTVFVTVMTVLLFFGLSKSQLSYIWDYEIPPLDGCSYYDKFDNIIYTSQFEGICPELSNLEYTKSSNGYPEKLTFTVKEEAYGLYTGRDYYEEELDDNAIIVDLKVRTIKESSFEYIYHNKSQLKKITIVSQTMTYLSDSAEVYEYSKMKRVIENVLEENMFNSEQTTYEYKIKPESGFEVPSLKDINFDEITPKVVVYNSVITETIDNGNVHRKFDIMSSTFDQGQQNDSLLAKVETSTSKPKYTYFSNKTISLYKDNHPTGELLQINDRYQEVTINYQSSAFDRILDIHEFVYGDSILSGKGGVDYLPYLNSYDYLEDMGLQRKVTNQFSFEKDTLYASNNIFSYEINETEYGKKVMIYNIFKLNGQKYTKPYNNGGRYKGKIRSLEINKFHDYGFLLTDTENKGKLIIYQTNPLYEFFEMYTND